MLNLFKINLNKRNEKKVENKKEKSTKPFPSSTREWNNSIYVYNKKTLSLIPDVTKLSMKLIRSYFSMYNYEIERKLRKSRLLRRLRKLSSNKIYISNGEFKHTNNKVLINLYIYNRQRSNYIKKIQKGCILAWWNIINISKKLALIRNTGILSIRKANADKMLLVKTLESLTIKKEIINYRGISKYINKFYKILIKKSLMKIKLYFFYKQLVLINEFKFEYVYLQQLKKYLEKIYNKNVEFNLVNLRRFYLNSDLLTESLVMKLRRNRRKLLKHLNILKRKIKISNTKKYYDEPNLKLNSNRIILANKNNLEKIVFNNLKYKKVTGFRLEASGRLTRRYTASRSIHKIRYKGNLLNIDSSYKGLSSVLLKGNLNPNLQYTKLNSKTRIGSFGIKGWVSGN